MLHQEEMRPSYLSYLATTCIICYCTTCILHYLPHPSLYLNEDWWVRWMLQRTEHFYFQRILLSLQITQKLICDKMEPQSLVLRSTVYAESIQGNYKVHNTEKVKEK
jgi:hypothetical protein